MSMARQRFTPKLIEHYTLVVHDSLVNWLANWSVVIGPAIMVLRRADRRLGNRQLGRPDGHVMHIHPQYYNGNKAMQICSTN